MYGFIYQIHACLNPLGFKLSSDFLFSGKHSVAQQFDIRFNGFIRSNVSIYTLRFLGRIESALDMLQAAKTT